MYESKSFLTPPNRQKTLQEEYDEKQRKAAQADHWKKQQEQQEREAEKKQRVFRGV